MTDSTPTVAPENQTLGSAEQSDLGGSRFALDAKGLIALLTRQRDIYQQLGQLAQKQGQLVRDGSAEPLLTLLAQRQQLVDELTKINGQMEPYRNHWQQFYSGLPDQDRQQVGPLVKEVEQLLSAIIQQDDHDRTQLEEAKRAVGQEIGRVTHGGAALHAYKASPSASGGGHLTDRKG